MGTVPIYVVTGQSNARFKEVELGVAATLQEAGLPHQIVVDAHGGRGFEEKVWFPDWNVNSEDDLYDGLVANIKAEMAKIGADGDTPTLAGVFWIHGETDGLKTSAADAYDANLQAFIDGLRGEFGPDFDMVVTEVRGLEDTVPLHTTIRAAQETVAEANPGVFFMDTDHLDLRVGNIHYDVASRIALGEEMAAFTIPKDQAAGEAPHTGRVFAIGRGGDDTLMGENGRDVLVGKGGRDLLIAAGGDDQLRGVVGSDLMHGGSGNDRLWGGDKHDTLAGGAGVDRLFGGERDDMLMGGEDRDFFVFRDIDGGRSDDVIFDYEDGLDRIILRNLHVTEAEDTADGARLIFDTGATVVIRDTVLADFSSRDFILQQGSDISLLA